MRTSSHPPAPPSPPTRALAGAPAAGRTVLFRALALAALVAAALLGLAAAPRHVSAQETAAPAEPGTAELQALVKTLEDETKRSELLASIRALIAARQQAASERPAGYGEQALDYVAEVARDAQETMVGLARSFDDWPVLVAWIKRESSDPAARARGMDEALAFVALFAAGSAAEWLLWGLFAGTRRRLDGSAPLRGTAKVMPVIIRTLIDFLPLLAFAGAAYATALIIEPSPKVQAVGLNFVHAYLLARALNAAARLLLSPAGPALRLLPLTDVVARDLYVWFRRFVVVGVCGYFVIVAAFLLGLPRRGADALLTILGLIVALMAIAFVLCQRRAVAAWLRRRAGSASQRLGGSQLFFGLAAIWHVLAIAYVIGFFVVAAFRIEGGFALMARGTGLSVLIVAVAWLLFYGIRAAVEAVERRPATPSADASAADTPGLSERLRAYLQPVAVILRVLVVVGAIVLMLETWGIAATEWFGQPAGRRLLGALTSIALVLAIAVLVWEVASGAIERYLRQANGDGTAQHSARVRTLLPLLRKALFMFLSLMVVLITLSEIGIDIAPLLAGAGVIGLAIGFGAQKLVQDVITGIFMLLEDAIAVGDVVSVAGISGQVEDLSIRSIRLRDLSGAVHTVPFSSVETVTNMTKDFSYAVLDVGVAYREDTDRVVEVCRELAEELRGELPYAIDILEPMEVLGVDKFADSAVIIKVRIKTRPIRQWAIAREFNRRMKKRFDALGIEIPFPYRTIQLLAEGQKAEPPQKASPPAESPAPVTPAAPAPDEFPAPPPDRQPSPAPQPSPDVQPSPSGADRRTPGSISAETRD